MSLKVVTLDHDLATIVCLYLGYDLNDKSAMFKYLQRINQSLVESRKMRLIDSSIKGVSTPCSRWGTLYQYSGLGMTSGGMTEAIQ